MTKMVFQCSKIINNVQDAAAISYLFALLLNFVC